MIKLSILVFFLLLCANVVFASGPSVLLLSERHRTEWNWVEYCCRVIRLKFISV